MGAENNCPGINTAAVPAAAVVFKKSRLFIFLVIVFFT
tara:strand:- start:1236 stop:1349 length:114 start_codon:yes stop_codon:yes gene_type:complete